MVTYTSSCSAAANVPSCPPDKRGPGVRQFETDFCVGAQNPLLATEGIGAEKVRFLGYRTFAARQKREHMPLFHCGSGPGRLGSTRATLTRACRKAFGSRFLRKACHVLEDQDRPYGSTRSGRRHVRTNVPDSRNRSRVGKSAFRRHAFPSFARLARRRKGPFFWAPPLVLTEQGRRGTENAFPPHVASRKRARDAAPRLPGRGSLPSIAVSTRHGFFSPEAPARGNRFR